LVSGVGGTDGNLDVDAVGIGWLNARVQGKTDPTASGIGRIILSNRPPFVDGASPQPARLVQDRGIGESYCCPCPQVERPRFAALALAVAGIEQKFARSRLACVRDIKLGCDDLG
jgi:hypothetical protein